MAQEPEVSQQVQLSIKMLNSGNKMEKFGACRELSKVENRGLEPVWKALMKRSEDPDKDVRREVASGLGIVSNKGEVKTVTTLCAMTDDREWTVREAAIRAVVQVDCGLKQNPESWKPAENRVKAVIVRALLDPVEQVRSAAAEALSHAVEKGDEIIFEVLVAGGRDIMSVIKAGSVPSTPLKSQKSQRLEHTPSSRGSTRTTRGTESSASRPKTPGEETCEVFWSRVGVAQDIEGILVRSKPAHPPMPPEALLPNAELLSGKVAFFGQSKRGSVPMFYDCAWRAKRAGAIGALFVTEGNAERMAAEEYHIPEGSHTPEDLAQGWGIRLDFPVAFVDPHCAGYVVDKAWVSIFPEKSMRKALLGDPSAAVRIAALQTICDIATCDDVRLIEALTEMLADSDRAVRQKCVSAFSQEENVQPGNRNAIAGLALQTEHDDPLVREAAIQALCCVCKKELGQHQTSSTFRPTSSRAPDPNAIDALKRRLQDKEGIVKKHAVDGLIQLAMDGGGVTHDDMSIITTFIDGMNDLDPLVVTACAKALARLSAEEGSVSGAFSWMVDSRLTVRTEAVESLGGAKKGNLVARAMLMKKFSDNDPPVRAAAVRGLSKVAADHDEEVADFLIQALADPASVVRLQAIDGIELIASEEGCPFMVKGCEALIFKMGDVDALVRQRVSEAVLRVAKGRDDVVARLQGLLTNTDSKIRKAALQTVADLLPPGDPKTMESVFLCFDDENAEVKKSALHIFQGQSTIAQEKGSLPSSAAEKLLVSCQHEDPLVATVAIEAFPLIMPKGHRDSIMALVKCLKHESSGVREASARVMGEIAEPGDERAISCLLPLLDSSMGYVRLAALQSLVKLGGNGDERMVKAATSRLNDREVYVRREAVDALQRVAIQGDNQAVDALVKCLDDQDDRIRYSAMAGLGNIAKPGDKVALGSLFSRLGVEGRAGRKHLVEKALSLLVVASDQESIAQLLMTFDDPDDGVKRAGVAAILSIVPQGDSKVLSLILETKFKHEDRKVRAVATEALQGLSVPGDAKVIAGMLGCLDDHHPQVRKNGAEALATLVPKGHVDTIAALSNVLGDSMADVRKAAMQSLVVITDKNNSTVIEALCGKLKSSEWHVRAAATDALSKLCDIGDGGTIEALVQLLQDPEWFVREAALFSMGKMAKPCGCKLSEDVACECTYVAAVLEVIEDTSAKVRKAAIDTLQRVGSRKDKRVGQACRGRLKDADIHVRNSAEQALKRFS